jgi:hypothetical protein
MHGGSSWSPGGGQLRDTWLFNFDTGTWSRKADYSVSTLEMVSAYDPATGNMLVCGPNSNNALMEFNPTNNTWTTKINYSCAYGQNAALDPDMRAFVAVGNGYMLVFNLNGGTRENWSSSTNGPDNVINARYPGIEYDPVSKRLVAWAGGRDVYSLNIQTRTWTRHTGTGDNPGSAISTGTFNRWRYVPSKNVFIVVNSIDANVFAYRHTAGTTHFEAIALKCGAINLTANPNPFKTSVKIAVSGKLVADGKIGVYVYNIKGKIINKLSATSYQLSAGITWSATDRPVGVYLVRVKAGKNTLTRKIILTD